MHLLRRDALHLPVRAIDNFVYMMTSSKWRPGTILENLYAPQNFDPVFLSRLFGPSSPSSPERGPTELPFKAISNGVRGNVSKNFVFEGRTAVPKLRSEWLTCYEAKENLR